MHSVRVLGARGCRLQLCRGRACCLRDGILLVGLVGYLLCCCILSCCTFDTLVDALLDLVCEELINIGLVCVVAVFVVVLIENCLECAVRPLIMRIS